MNPADAEARDTWLAERPDVEVPDPDELGCGVPGSCGAARCYCLRLVGRSR